MKNKTIPPKNKLLILLAIIHFFGLSPLLGEEVKIPSAIEENRYGFLIRAPEEARYVAETGAAWLRPHPGPFAWEWIEPEKGNFDFSQTDSYVKKAQENNCTILAIIWPYAEWDQKTCHGSESQITSSDHFYPYRNEGIPIYRGVPCNFDDYKSFLAKLVERYDGDGNDDMPGLKIPIRYWEVASEPDIKEGYLTFFKGNAEDYGQLLMNSREAIQAGCWNCKVVQGAAAGILPAISSFWKDVFTRGGARYFDIANIHYINEGDSANLNVKGFKELLSNAGVNKPIWVTEAKFDSEKGVLSSVEGARNAGAEKIFFSQFKIGQPGTPQGGEYSEVYKEIIKKP